MSISGQIVSDTLTGYTQKTPYKAKPSNFLDNILSEYPDKYQNFRNFIFMTSHFSSTILRLIGSSDVIRMKNGPHQSGVFILSHFMVYLKLFYFQIFKGKST